jgi:LuxR family maltose regulon positive regulatory protein
VRGDYREARRLLGIARQATRGPDSNFIKICSESAEGLIDMRQARLQQALARFRIAASTMLPNRYERTNGNAMAGILLAEALYETGDQPQDAREGRKTDSGRAERLLSVYVPLARDLGLADQIISGYLVLARILFERGDVDRAYTWLAELEDLGHRRELPRLVMGAMLERARLSLRQGNRHAAAEALVAAADVARVHPICNANLFSSDIHDLTIGELRLALHGKPDASTLVAIERELALAVDGERLRRALKLRILLAWGYHAHGDSARGAAVLADALRFGAAEGFVRIFAEEGEPVRQLVASVCATLGDALPVAYVERLLFACEIEPTHAPDATPSAMRQAQALVEPLTPKEHRVLELLAEGFSNQAMAERLFVSETTVRTHLRNISAKLRASNRTQAVAIARQLGLL